MFFIYLIVLLRRVCVKKLFDGSMQNAINIDVVLILIFAIITIFIGDPNQKLYCHSINWSRQVTQNGKF